MHYVLDSVGFMACLCYTFICNVERKDCFAGGSVFSKAKFCLKKLATVQLAWHGQHDYTKKILAQIHNIAALLYWDHIQ